MRLFVAEKPSLGRAIAEALPGSVEKKDRLSIVLSGGDTVCWSAGHILELLNPEEINPAYKQWRLSTLPIVPDEWKLKPKNETKDLLDNIGRLLEKADVVVNAGDADREGQLLVDEILHHFNYQGKVLRILVTDMNKSAIQQALQNMRPNEEYKNLSAAAEARQRADWLLGLNMTRLFTVTTERKHGKIISVGRVQTPTLALVVERDILIENFISTPFFVIKARCIITNGEFTATWRPSEDQQGLDSEGRIVASSAISELEKKLTGKLGHVTKFLKKATQTPPPQTYSLPKLQSDAAKKYDLSPAQTLKILQSLYEAKYVTYPRSDCGYLPETLYENRDKVLKAICTFSDEYTQYEFDLNQKTESWNTGKVEEHHAIVPTGTIPQNLSGEQKKIYDLVARRYAAQFLPAQEFANVEIEFKIVDEVFSAKTKQCSKTGWSVLYGKNDIPYNDSDEQESVGGNIIPDAVRGENVGIRELIREEKKTSPPKRYAEATLLTAMNNIHRFVTDPEIKKTLKETSGIGTAATQASIIENLKHREFIVKEQKNIISTPKGRALIDVVVDLLRKPDTTAKWENCLYNIQEGRLSQEAFLREIVETVREITKNRQNVATEKRVSSPHGLETDPVPCPGCKDGRMVQLDGKFGKFWICGHCGLSLQDEGNKPQKTSTCPICGHIAARIRGKKGYFWGCRNQACKKTFKDNMGKLIP